jgi:tetratricopeptide (TPR) repeat protein
MKAWGWILVAAALLGALVVPALHHRRTQASPTRLTLVLEGPGLSPAELKGLQLHLVDHLEAFGGLTVISRPTDPQDGFPALSLTATRQGNGLSLRGRLRREGVATSLEAPGPHPADAVHGALSGLLGVRGPDPLDVHHDESFWALMGMLAGPYLTLEGDMAGTVKAAEALLARDPSASAGLARAHLKFRLLVASADADMEAHAACDRAFAEALVPLPTYPRLVNLYARFRTDVGDQKGALELTFRALKDLPKVASLHDSAAYAARTSGLLEGAVRAARRRDELGGTVGQDYFLVENTLLYQGHWEAFQQGLEATPAREPVQAFYLGYIRLLRGRPDAEEAFAAALRTEAGLKVFRRLSEVYFDALQGRKDQALAKLRAIDEDRVRTLVPDGELTFKLAEAYGYLGREGEAFDLAQRAFGQGFACTEWYRRAPFLAALQGKPAWKGLLVTMRERQERMEARFPADRFGK